MMKMYLRRPIRAQYCGFRLGLLYCRQWKQLRLEWPAVIAPSYSDCPTVVLPRVLLDDALMTTAYPCHCTCLSTPRTLKKSTSLKFPSAFHPHFTMNRSGNRSSEMRM